MNSAPLFLAIRYLRPKRTFVSVITVISILGVALGVWMMIVVRSVMKGFEVEFRNALIAQQPHVLLEAEKKPAKGKPAADWQKLASAASGQPGAAAVSPFAGGMVFLNFDERQTGMQLFGLLPENASQRIDKLKKSLLAGSLGLADGSIVLPHSVADALGARIDDELSVYADDSVIGVLHQYRDAENESDQDKKKAIYRKIELKPLKLKVAGVVRDDYGIGIGYASLNTSQQVFKLGRQVSGIAIELQDPNEAKAFAARLRSTGAVPENWKTHLWIEAGEARLAAMANEQTMMQLVLVIIALVAAFSVMNTTITVTTQKRREIGVLTAVGAHPGQVMRIFVIQSLIVGIIGTVTGLAASFLFLRFRDAIRSGITAIGGGHVNAVDGVFLASIPAEVSSADVLWTCVVSVLLCLVAALLPAYFASRLDPAAALRE